MIEERESIDQDKLLSDISTPVLIIHGNKDKVVPLEHSRRAVKKLENSRLEVIDGLDHSYNTNHDEIVDYSKEWFDKTL